MYSSNSTIFGISSVGTHCLCLIYYWDILKLMIMIKNPILLLLLRISRCPQCKWPLCCSECRGLYTATGHSKTECTLLSRVNTQDFEYEPITPLRCVSLQTVDSAKWTLFNRQVQCVHKVSLPPYFFEWVNFTLDYRSIDYGK